MLKKNSIILLIFSLLYNIFPVLPVDAARDANKVAGVSFTAPEAWTSTQPSSSMRVFQFTVPGATLELSAEMAVFYFGEGMGGGIQANIDRWKGQFEKLTGENTEKRRVNGIDVVIVTLKGVYQPSGGPMMASQGPPLEDFAVLGAIVAAPQGPVFFKMTGPQETIDHAREDFNQLISSLHNI